MIWAVTYSSTVWGTGEVIKYYMFPWLLVSHWFIMITYVSILSTLGHWVIFIYIIS